VVDRSALEQAACECYRTICSRFEKLSPGPYSEPDRGGLVGDISLSHHRTDSFLDGLRMEYRGRTCLAAALELI
jgi:hypothetical protein